MYQQIKINNSTTKNINTITAKKTNVMSIASINFHSKKVFTYSFISDHIPIDNCYYLLSLCKTKRYYIKWKIMNLKKFVLKMVHVIISMTIKLEDFDLDKYFNRQKIT